MTNRCGFCSSFLAKNVLINSLILDALKRRKVAEHFHPCQRQFCPSESPAYGGLAWKTSFLLDFDHMPPRQPKHNCYIVAGSNGAGKTTFATEFLPRYA